MQTRDSQQRHTVVEKMAIAASPDAVWERMRNFNALSDWHPAVASGPADRGNNVGSVRRLGLHGGGEIVETLLAHSDAERGYSYRAQDGGALPVAGYVSSLHVRPDGAGRSLVEWRGDFHAVTAPGRDAAEVVKAIAGVYQAGLAQLKQLAEGR
jgi:hypothetical protein